MKCIYVLRMGNQTDGERERVERESYKHMR